MPKNYEHRERKIEKRRNGMRTSNRSIFTVRDVINRKAKDAREYREHNDDTSQLDSGTA